MKDISPHRNLKESRQPTWAEVKKNSAEKRAGLTVEINDGSLTGGIREPLQLLLMNLHVPLHVAGGLRFGYVDARHYHHLAVQALRPAPPPHFTNFTNFHTFHTPPRGKRGDRNDTLV